MEMLSETFYKITEDSLPFFLYLKEVVQAIPEQDFYKSVDMIIKIGGITFGAGVTWAVLRALGKNLDELKAGHNTLINLVSKHDTEIALHSQRIEVLETAKKPKRKT